MGPVAALHVGSLRMSSESDLDRAKGGIVEKDSSARRFPALL
jgi:hypothetical protein